MKYLLFLALASITLACSSPEAPQADKTQILATLEPYQQIAQRLVGDAAQVQVLVPKGASPHSFEPTPRQMEAIARAVIWFQVGEVVEERVEGALAGLPMKRIPLYEGIDLIEADEHDHHHHADHDHHHHHDFDPHFWLSPRLLSIQALEMSRVLQERFPDAGDAIRSATADLILEMQQLDEELTALLEPHRGKTVLVSHAAYAYFCRDYGIEQLAIEQHGRDPTPRQLTHLLQRARALGVSKILVQPQHSDKGAKVLGEELGAELIEVDPFASDYAAMLRRIAEAVASE